MQLPVGDEKRQAVRAMFDSIAPRYDVVNKAMTFGLDIWWRRRTLALLGLGASSTVLDAGCGTGDFTRAVASSGGVPIGLDISAKMLAHARTGGSALVLGDAASIPLRTSSVDGAVSGFALRNFADLPGALGEIGRVVRPGGRIALLEVSEPKSKLLRAGYRVWFKRAVPFIGKVLSDPAAYRYLPESVAYLPEPDELRRLVENAGFVDVRRILLSGGVVQVLTGTRSDRVRP